MKAFPPFDRQERLALAAIAAFILLFFKPVIAGDGFGYYVILEGAVRDHSFNLSSQLRYNAIAGGEEVFWVNATGTYASQYAPGLPLLSAPFYAVSLLADKLPFTHISDDFFIKERGDILVHQASMALTTLMLVAVALVFSLLLARENGYTQGGLALALAFFGSPFLRYATYDLTYTHAAEAGILALAIYAFWKNKPAWQIGALLGLMTLVRFTSALFFIPFLAYYACRKELKNALHFGLGGLPFAIALMAYFTAQFGGPLTTGYTANPGYDAKNFSLLPIHVGRVLFSLDGNPPGLLLWTPIVALALIGVYSLKDPRKWVLLGIAALMLWHTGSLFEGTTGFSYSNRYFAALFPIIVIGTAAILQQGRGYPAIAIAMGAYGLIMFLLVFSVDWGHFASYAEVLAYWFFGGNLAQLPGALLEKMGIIRLLLLR